MPTINLSSPWVILYRELEAMFKNDKEIKVVLNDDTKNISICVDGGNEEKATALDEILVHEYHFGNVVTKVNVLPSNCIKVTPSTIKDTYENAFKNNPALSYILFADLPLVSANIYVVFKNEVVQYFDDNLLDVNGNCSTLYQEIAKKIFQKDPIYSICYCTDIPGNIGKPIGEWP